MCISRNTPHGSSRHHGSPVDGTPALDPPSGEDTRHPKGLPQRLKAWARGLSADAVTRLCLLGFILLVIGSCYLLTPDPTRLKVYVHGPEERVFIDGAPVTAMRKHAPSYPFAGSFSLAGEKPDYEITIKNGGEVIHRKRVGKGAYLINATTDSWVAADSVIYGGDGHRLQVYGTMEPRSYMIGPGGLGVYQIDANPDSCRAVNFGCDPPFSISNRSPGSRSSSPVSSGGYVQLFEGKIEGSALTPEREQPQN